VSHPNDKSNFAADQEGLRVAQTVARIMGVNFDPDAARESADNLHRSYFDAITSLLGPTVTSVDFDASALRLINAFAEHSEQGTEKIFFDEQLDFWLLTCAQLTAVAACKQLEAAEYRDLISLFLATLEVPNNPYLHEEYRPRFKHFLFAYHDCLELSHALSRAMIVFTICHELGHVQLGHTRTDESLTHEIEADELAATFFAKVIEAGTSAGHIFVHPKLSGAPILMMHFFDMFERHRFKQTGRTPSRSTHPHPLERGKRLRECLSQYLDADAFYVLDGFIAALEDIAGLANLKQTIII
jgi:hypothetical protein